MRHGNRVAQGLFLDNLLSPIPPVLSTRPVSSDGARYGVVTFQSSLVCNSPVVLVACRLGLFFGERQVSQNCLNKPWRSDEDRAYASS